MSAVSASLTDDELLEALRRAVSAREAVPPDFVAAAKDAFAWHNIDAELARLTYDSRDAGHTRALATRTEAAFIRALTFTSGRLTIELEVAQDSLVGQIVPAQPAEISVIPRTGSEIVIAADEIGCFSVEPIPHEQFRLRCRTSAGVETMTGWITL